MASLLNLDTVHDAPGMPWEVGMLGELLDGSAAILHIDATATSASHTYDNENVDPSVSTLEASQRLFAIVDEHVASLADDSPEKGESERGFSTRPSMVKNGERAGWSRPSAARGAIIILHSGVH